MKAVKGNKELRIHEEKKDEYLAMGYTITDDAGKVIADPGDVVSEKDEIVALTEKVAGLEAQVEELEKVNADLKAKLDAAKKPKAEKSEEPKKATEDGEANK